jgi:hypothetical protein
MFPEILSIAPSFYPIEEGGAPMGVSSRVFPNLRRMHKYWNLPLHKQLSFNFLASFLVCRKEIFAWEHGNI